MATPLLRTKLYIPTPRPEWVPRPHLIGRLNTGLDRKLTLISAPAGFGKTTLLTEFAAASPRPVAWVSLDAGDNDPVRFWTYFVAALQTLEARVAETALGEASLAMLHSSQPPPIEALLAGLINEIAEVPAPFALVLDDFHVITDQQIQDAATLLLDNLPPQMHLILSSRSDPPWTLARLRACGEMTELRAEDLRFTSEEVAAFLNDVMGLGLSTEDIMALDTRTEGWIAGLKLAAISMQGYDATAFIRAFSGSHRFILDYLVEEVLDRQPPQIREFLLRTSILEGMTASLCDAVRFGEAEVTAHSEGRGVTDESEGQTILAQLDRANLFLVPLDNERRWYRYHHLFADLLRSRLELVWPDQVPVLHRRASEWYEQKGLVAEAVSHALASGDIERVAGLVEESVFTMIYHGQLKTVVGWLDALPDEVVRSRPWLSIAHAWTLAYSGELDAVEALLRDAEEALLRVPTGMPDLDESARRHIAGHIATIRGYRAVFTGDLARAAELAREAMKRLPKDDLATRGFAALMLAATLGMSGNPAAGIRALSEAANISQAAEDSLLAIMVLCEKAGLQLIQGQLHRVAATCQDALQLADEHARRSGHRSPVVGFAYARLSYVLREWNELEAATRYGREAVELCKRWGQRDSLVTSCIYLALALQAAGDEDGALDGIRRARQVAGGFSSSKEAHSAATEARLHLAQGDTATASRWAQETGLSVEDELRFDRSHEYRTFARVLVSQGRLDEALALLVRLLRLAEAAGAMGQVIEILVLQAMALHAQGGVERAVATLGRALRLGEPEGYVRIFVDDGKPMAQLLRQAAARGIAVDYVGKLLEAFETEDEQKARLAHRTPTALMEPLSAREIEILRLLAAGLSNKEIARTLVIAVGTTKKHLSNVYGKLGVHSRTQAVARARDLGIL